MKMKNNMKRLVISLVIAIVVALLPIAGAGPRKLPPPAEQAV